MIEINIKQMALEYVRKHKCAVPVEVVEKAMEQAAAEAIKQATKRLQESVDGLAEMRRRNIG